MRRHPPSTLFPYTTLFRSRANFAVCCQASEPTFSRRSLRVISVVFEKVTERLRRIFIAPYGRQGLCHQQLNLRRFPIRIAQRDRKSTRLNSSHVEISYAVF